MKGLEDQIIALCRVAKLLGVKYSVENTGVIPSVWCHFECL